MDCRSHCGACCIAPSITSPLPDPVGAKAPGAFRTGKPAGVPCPHLDETYRCRLFGKPERPAVCASLKPSLEMCGTCRDEAMDYLTRLERATGPCGG